MDVDISDKLSHSPWCPRSVETIDSRREKLFIVFGVLSSAKTCVLRLIKFSVYIEEVCKNVLMNSEFVIVLGDRDGGIIDVNAIGLLVIDAEVEISSRECD